MAKFEIEIPERFVDRLKDAFGKEGRPFPRRLARVVLVALGQHEYNKFAKMREVQKIQGVQREEEQLQTDLQNKAAEVNDDLGLTPE